MEYTGRTILLLKTLWLHITFPSNCS